MTKIVMGSWFRNDSGRDLTKRVVHLLDKANGYHDVRFLWLVGDSTDETEDLVRGLADRATDDGVDVEVRRHDTGIIGSQPEVRFARLNQMLVCALGLLRPEDDYFLLHESDLQTPRDLIPRLLATGKRCVAGWPTLGSLFYDSWAYHRHGTHFSNYPPYHACYEPKNVFEVDGAGSVILFPAEHAPYVVPEQGCIAEVCRKLRARGETIWVDPTIQVVQPVEFWKPERPVPVVLR